MESQITGEAAETSMQKDALAEIIDSGGTKNMIPSGQDSGTGTRYANITMTVPKGQYVLYFSSITSDDTDANTCQVCAFTSGNVAATVAVQCRRGNEKHVILDVLQEAAYIRVYASDTHAHGADDTVAFTDAMLCKKAYWDISQKYVPPGT